MSTNHPMSTQPGMPLVGDFATTTRSVQACPSQNRLPPAAGSGYQPGSVTQVRVARLGAARLLSRHAEASGQRAPAQPTCTGASSSSFTASAPMRIMKKTTTAAAASSAAPT